MIWLLLPLMLCPATLLAAEHQPLFAKGADSVTFVLKDSNGKTPRIVLFGEPAQAETAESINYWRETPDLLKAGVAVDFKAIRFLRNDKQPGKVILRLVGIKNELELGVALSLADLESGKPQRLHFGPATIGAGVVSGTTDARMLLEYLPETRALRIAEVSGQFEWKRLLNDPQSDSGKLENVSGAVGTAPPGETILKSQMNNKRKGPRRSSS